MQPRVTIPVLKQAIETSDAATLTGLYAEDAELRIIDRDNPPSRPRALTGKSAIAAFYADVCSRAMTHTLEDGVAAGDRLAFTQRCAYPDGTAVYCAMMLELADGKIRRQTTVQAWDS